MNRVTRAVVCVPLATALVALAACDAAVPDSSAASPSTATSAVEPAATQAAGAGIVFFPDEFPGLVGESDTPAGLTLDAFWISGAVSESAPDTVVYFAPEGFDDPGCADHAMFLELVQPSDVDQGARGDLMYWFEYGVSDGDDWTTATIVSARLFDTGAAAGAFLQWGSDAVARCAGGYIFTAEDGDQWVVARTGEDDPGVTFPDEVAVFATTAELPAEGTASHFVFLQFGNLVVSLRADDTGALTQPPQRLDETARLIAERLVALAGND